MVFRGKFFCEMNNLTSYYWGDPPWDMKAVLRLYQYYLTSPSVTCS